MAKPTLLIIDRKHDREDLLGQFLDDSHYSTLIENDTDVYLGSVSEENCILKFRKGYFTKAEQAGAYDGLMEAAKPTQNRGLAAGPKRDKCQNRDWVTNEQMDILIYLSKVEGLVTHTDLNVVKAKARARKDSRGLVWLGEQKKEHNFDFETWLENLLLEAPNASMLREQANWCLTELVSDTTYANPVDSGIAGWFDRYPRIPYGRATSYTAHNKEKFKLSFPFLQHLDKAFASLLPKRHNAQLKEINKLDKEFYVPDTVFTTITVNKNFRTAAHRDAGDLTSGFSNLSVVAKDNDYTGGHLVLPEIDAAVAIRPGDLLLVSNHDYIHGNTPIESKEGVVLERISLVCYFREKMLELGSKRYEDARYAFVEARRKDTKHKLWRDGWNGVSHGMWETEEWYDFLEQQVDGTAMLSLYHPQESSLESLFG